MRAWRGLTATGPAASARTARDRPLWTACGRSRPHRCSRSRSPSRPPGPVTAVLNHEQPPL